MPPTLVDYLGVVSTPNPAPQLGDMIQRDINGKLKSFPPGAVGDFLQIGQDGRPGWLAQNPYTLAPLAPSGGDDTAAINTAVAAGRQLGVGTFKISGVVIGCPLGQGSALTKIQATAAAARIRHGPAMNTSPVQVGGSFGGFTLDGVGIAGSTAVPLMTSNVVSALYRDLIVTGSAGDGMGVYGQNCVFVQCGWANGTTGNNGMVMDQGTGGNVFLRCEYAHSPGYALEFRQTADAAASAYIVPTNNVWYGCIFETLGSSASVAGLIHVLNGLDNRFDICQIACGGAAPYNVVLEQGNTNAYPWFNCRTFFRDCEFDGGTVAAIQSKAGGLFGDYAMILQGDTTFGANHEAIEWNSSTPMRMDGTWYNSGVSDMVFYQKGAGAPDLQYGPSQILIPWAAPTFHANASSLAGYTPVGARVDRLGNLKLRGLISINGPIPASTPIITLPPGQRPPYTVVLDLLVSTGTMIGGFIDTNGQLTSFGAFSAGQWITLDGKEFPLA